MNIPKSIALGMQGWLRVISYDCYTADAFTSGLGVEGERARWQLAVDTVYRFLVVGLIWSPPAVEVNLPECRNHYFQYACELAKSNPFAAEPLEISPWIAWDLCATELCRSLVRRHELQTRDIHLINEKFLSELEDLFEKYNVAWRSEPLIQIRD